MTLMDSTTQRTGTMCTLIVIAAVVSFDIEYQPLLLCAQSPFLFRARLRSRIKDRNSWLCILLCSFLSCLCTHNRDQTERPFVRFCKFMSFHPCHINPFQKVPSVGMQRELC